MKNKLLSLSLFAVLVAVDLHAQQSKTVLFVGNSYTAVNDLPGMVANIAASLGDTLEYTANTPGGATFSAHCSNQSMTLIRQGGWDAVVLQEQSQYPAFPDFQVQAEVFPYAKRLVDSIYAHSVCAEPIFYMTWGHKYGDTFNAEAFPPLATYEGMDSLLALRYTQMADLYDASLCPVGRVWHWLRDNHAEIELYQDDNSHPTTEGTYVAACAFNTLIFGRDPLMANYEPQMMSNAGQVIRQAVHDLVYDSLASLQRPLPKVATLWSDTVQYMQVSFEVECLHVDTLGVDWGDGHDTLLVPAGNVILSHSYADTGTYTIIVKGSRHCMADEKSCTFTAQTLPEDTTHIGNVQYLQPQCTPNPAFDRVRVQVDDESGWVEVCDLQGRVLMREKLTGGACTLEVGSLPQGVYIVRCSKGATRLAVTR